jgi:2-oxoglutarate ferredoxin oxidoreductase subunit alpha
MQDFEPIATQSKPRAGDDAPSHGLFVRDPATLGRPWVTPGTPGLMHRIGGLEKDLQSGHISYDAANHQAMTDLRRRKVELVADFIPEQTVEIGPDHGTLAVVGWGSTFGAIYQAVRRLSRKHKDVSHIHLRHLSPFPKNLGRLLAGFDQVIVPEMNMGQLAAVLRDKLGIDPVQFNKVSGQPFQITELVQFIEARLDSKLQVLPRVMHGEGQ